MRIGGIWERIKEALINSARAGIERFFPTEGSKSGGILYVFRFLNRTDEGKDPLPAADELFRGSIKNC